MAGQKQGRAGGSSGPYNHQHTGKNISISLDHKKRVSDELGSFFALSVSVHLADFFFQPHEVSFYNAYIDYKTVTLISVKHQNILQI